MFDKHNDDGLVTRKGLFEWRQRTGTGLGMQENNYGSDVNIWLVSDLGLIITLDQYCQFLCRMPYNLQNSQIPLSSTRRQEGRVVSLILYS